MQLGDRIILARTIDGQDILATINAATYAEDEHGYVELHWPVAYVEQVKPGELGHQVMVAAVPLSPVFAVASRRYRLASYHILDDKSAKTVRELYDRRKHEEQGRDSGLVLARRVPSNGNGRPVELATR